MGALVGGAQHLGDTKVPDLHHPLLCQEDVVRLQVPVTMAATIVNDGDDDDDYDDG